MSLKQKFITIILSTALIFSSVSLVPMLATEAEAVSITRQQAIERYHNFQDSYNRQEVPIIRAFEQQYDGSLAHQVVARAIWYMEHGYMIYNFAGGYPTNGLIDCSNFTQLVYRDFGINITSRSRDYDKVGTRVPGVSSTRVGTSSSGQALYGIKGIENLRPGDILTYWAGTETNKYISHVAIYMGVINGKPAIINTVSNRPTAIGIVNNFSYWYGEKFLEARRILPNDAWNPAAAHRYTDSGPVIPTNYYLPPQRPIVMPSNQVLNNNEGSSNNGNTPSITGQVQVTGNTVNLRSGPGTNFSIVAVARNGEVLNVTGKSGSWFNIRMSNGSTGFIADWLVRDYSSSSNNTNTSNDSSSSQVLVSTVTGHVVNVRATASTSGNILGVVRNGNEVVVKRQLNGWYEIDFNGQSGYVASFLLSNPVTKTVTTSTSTATVSGNIVNVRSGAGTNHSIIAVVRRGDTVEVLGQSNGWTQVKIGNNTGFISSNLLSF
ncbi:SH3 domain-containing protein [Desulfuribacillus alkaliarsenatis]|uniref:SH3 domain-containing protein n=1 Tax=Desulfuribacillus alkaliarsenatis TaxID=766136 RepID=A0A1E5G6L0_9FIRM|nr:SH3 domain-containing protein [Desulfuribacillus alkaliarsenatis]OEF98729.1 hypothetical protein BHF68_03460 [Desulfuribacillus alkaliarsenatis]